MYVCICMCVVPLTPKYNYYIRTRSVIIVI